MESPRYRGFEALLWTWLVATIVVTFGRGYDIVAIPILFFIVATHLARPVALVLWALVPVSALALAIRVSLARQFRYAGFLLMVPIASVLLYHVPEDVGEILRFRLNKATYDMIVESARHGHCSPDEILRWNVTIDMASCSGPVTIIFLWGGFLSSWHGVVYDANDDIAKPYCQRSAIWRSRTIGSLLSYSGARSSLGNHFYLAGGNYVGPGGEPKCL